MTNHDHYRTLGLTPGASEQDILQAYRRLAMRWHPDRNQDRPVEAEEKFKLLQQAYAVLRDAARKAEYDAARAAAAAAATARPHGSGGSRDNTEPRPRSGPTAADDAASPIAGVDYVCETTIPLETAVLGGTATTRVRMTHGCPRCQTRGRILTPCRACAGTGQVGRGLFNLNASCVRCDGHGTTSSLCDSCAGAGQVRVDKSLRVGIKPGVVDGLVLRARGMGGPGSGGGPAGNLLCRVRIKKDRIFGVSGLDLTRELKIDFVLACLGGSIPLPRFRKSLTVQVPAMTRSGTVLRLPGLGLHDRARQRTGDLLLTVVIDLPTRMRAPSDAQRQLLRDLALGR